MRITAVGDCAIQRNIPKFYDGFEEVKNFIMRGDVRFFNLETTVCEDCYPAKYSGGTWLRTNRNIAKDALLYGFNITTCANNHCMDFSYNGFLQTLENIKSFGLAPTGGGRTLAEASAPAYIDTPNGRAAVISCTTTYSPGAEAGEQSRDFVGRPGVNPIRTNKTVYVRADDLKALAHIAEITHINASRDIIRAEGYLPPLDNDSVEFGDTLFKLGEPSVKFELNAEDMKRIETSIKDALFQADTVLVSVHSHQIEGESKENVPEFLRAFAHKCIDSGAHAVIGHGPHLLRPVEIYKGLPIFYSLGDFLLQLENCEKVPYDYYIKHGLKPEAGLYEVFKSRTRNFTVGLQRQRVMMESVVASFDITDGKLQDLNFMPLELGLGMPHSQIGLPRCAKDNAIVDRLSEMSEIKF